jgi:glycosyltransferase involved in cell wall biosynthesis
MRVSCILPTRDRRRLIPVAIASYLSQDWEDKELVVVDDGADAIHDLLVGVRNLVYLRVAPLANLSLKRNAAIRSATGEIICHLDDDDWSHAGRITDQVQRLTHADAEVSGYHSVMFWDEADHRASRYIHGGGYSWGPCICYRRDYWAAQPWPAHVGYAEDNAFLFAARAAGTLVSAVAGDMMVLRLGSHNRRAEAGHRPYWPTIPASELPAAFRQAVGIEVRHACA